tara:strand:- start:242 stop:463 length:222 start_codon:yes stop_codon:yes gene_type:complete
MASPRKKKLRWRLNLPGATAQRGTTEQEETETAELVEAVEAARLAADEARLEAEKQANVASGTKRRFRKKAKE